MKKIIFLLFIQFTLNAQTNVDKLVERLDLLSNASFDNWKYSTNFSLTPAEISSATFDDSQWKNSTLNESLYLDSCWFRKTIEIPKYIAGVLVTGQLKFINAVDDYSYIWIDGESRGKFGWDAETILTQNAVPNQKFVVLIKAINTGGPLRLIEARISLGLESALQNLIRNLSTSFRVGQKLVSFDTYQTNASVKVDPGIDKSKIKKEKREELQKLIQKLAIKIDVDALANGDTIKFLSSVDQVKKELKPITEFARSFTLQFTANAHIDAAWLWRKKETEEVCKRTFSAVMNMFKARPGFTYTQSQAALYEWVKNDYPDLFFRIKSYIDNGRWEISGGMWVEPDCNLPSGDSWARQLLYGQSFFKKNFGKLARLGWNPDSFGYNWNLPQFMLNAGLDAFITQKIGWNDTNVFPYRVFWWQSPDGSKILTYFPFDYVNEVDDPFRLADWLKQFEANTGFQKLLVLFGVGDHGGGPSIQMMMRIDKLRELLIYPAIEFGTAENYINWLRKHDLSDIPVWNNELYLEYHRGTATTQSNTKKWNRENEILLTNAEKFSSISSFFGNSYEKELLKDAWKNVLFNQFHDILPGSGIREVYLDADKDYKESFQLGNHVLTNSLESISDKINTSKITEGKPLVVFNSLSWQRTDLAVVTLYEGDKNNYAIYSIEGVEIPSQLIETDKLNRKIIFVAENIPSLGYKVFVMKPSNKNYDVNKESKPEIGSKEIDLENNLFKVSVDLESGWIKNIFDKRLNKELLSGYGNKLQLLEDKPKAYDAWNIGLTGIEFPSTFRNVELVEDGTVRKVLRLYRDYLKPGMVKSFPTEDFPNSFFTQDIILYNNIDRIDFKTNVEWWEEKTMLKVAFPFNVNDTVATYEIPFGAIKRSTTLKAQWDKGKWEVNAQKWADLSNDEFGISLINKNKYGYDTRGNVMRLSLLRSPTWPDPTADRGDHSFEYSLFPHKGKVEESQTIFKGYEFNYPLLSLLTDSHEGTLPLEKSFVEISLQNVIVTSIKKTEENDNSWIITLYESKGIDSEIEIKLPVKPSKVVETNILEDDGKAVQFQNGIINLTVKMNAVKYIKFYL